MRLIEMTLKAKSYTLLKASDGKEALDIAVKEHPDLIIMDIQLPGMSGLDVAKRLRQMPEFSNTPVMALTAYAVNGDGERYIKAGFDACLSKPVNTRELPEVIAEILTERKQARPRH